MENNKNKLVYIGFAFPHHKGTHAGYNHIKDYLDYDYVIDTQKYIESFQKTSLLGKIRTRILKFKYLFKCSMLALFKGHVIFHFVHGENNFVPFPFMNFRGSKVVVTLHQPYSWFADNKIWLTRIPKIDVVTLVGKTEIGKFESLTHKKNVYFYAHGICTNFYNPGEKICNASKEKLVLMVGNWLRDFVFASKIFTYLENKSPDVKIVVVTNKSNAHYFETNKSVQVKSGISDFELLNLYRQASCLFLPLERYTANNALLEAGAVGCKILIASNHADNSYIPSNLLSICPLKEDIAQDKLMKILNSGSFYNGDLVDFVCKNYSWEVVASNFKEFLLDL